MKMTKKQLKTIIENELQGVVEAMSEKEKIERNTKQKRRQRKQKDLKLSYKMM